MIVIGEMVGPVVAMEVVTGGGVEEDVIVVVSVIVVQVFKVAGDVIHRAMQAAPFSPAAQGSKMLEHIAKNAKLGNLPMVLVHPPVSIVRQAHLPMVQDVYSAQQDFTKINRAKLRVSSVLQDITHLPQWLALSAKMDHLPSFH
jgi:hypothetical protein